jgi:hypothetical protein
MARKNRHTYTHCALICVKSKKCRISWYNKWVTGLKHDQEPHTIISELHYKINIWHYWIKCTTSEDIKRRKACIFALKTQESFKITWQEFQGNAVWPKKKKSFYQEMFGKFPGLCWKILKYMQDVMCLPSKTWLPSRSSRKRRHTTTFFDMPIHIKTNITGTKTMMAKLTGYEKLRSGLCTIYWPKKGNLAWSKASN